MSAPELRLVSTERDTLRMCAKLLESRAAGSDRVTVSAEFARVVARWLRKILEGKI